MLHIRLIPILLLHKEGLYKTQKFKKPKYVGDPINAIKIFNEKEVDELIFLDIDASKKNREPNYNIIEDIASECFMPLCYGGGIKTVEQMKRVFSLGVEKIALNSVLLNNLNLVKEATKIFGSQSIVASIDINKNIWGKYVIFDHVNAKNTALSPLSFYNKLQRLGIGEILMNAVFNDGLMKGFDVQLYRELSSHMQIPLIACGGAGSLNDCKVLIDDSEVSAVAAGSMFVFKGKHRAVLITYPERKKIVELSKSTK